MNTKEKPAQLGTTIIPTIPLPVPPEELPPAKLAAPVSIDQLFGAIHDTAMVIGKIDPNSSISLLYNRDTFKLKAVWKKQDKQFQFTSRSISPGTPIPTILDTITEFGVQLVEQVK